VAARPRKTNGRRESTVSPTRRSITATAPFESRARIEVAQFKYSISKAGTPLRIADLRLVDRPLRVRPVVLTPDDVATVAYLDEYSIHDFQKRFAALSKSRDA